MIMYSKVECIVQKRKNKRQGAGRTTFLPMKCFFGFSRFFVGNNGVDGANRADYADVPQWERLSALSVTLGAVGIWRDFRCSGVIDDNKRCSIHCRIITTVIKHAFLFVQSSLL